MALAFFSIIVIVLIYHPWMSFSGTLSSGDWPYLYTEQILKSAIFSKSLLWIEPYYYGTAKLAVIFLGLSWELTERLFWFWPFLILAIYSSWKLTKSWLGVLIYLTNTYILMLVGGGQMGVALAYALAPLVISRFFKVLETGKGVWGWATLLALQIMFDPRLALLTIAAMFLYRLLFYRGETKSWRLFWPILPLALFINFFWLIPILKTGFGNFGSFYTERGAADFLSFATFSNSLSLLHPNWPENIFGKIQFMRPEFLIIPVAAFLVLLKKSSSKSKTKILFFATLALLGAFFGKGAQGPFGNVYLWLFDNLPLFVMFRDPTKFYLLVSLAYAFLIPISLKSFKKIKYLSLVFLVYWLVLIQPAWAGQLSGTFTAKQLPEEYLRFKEFVLQQSPGTSFLWLPVRQRFAFTSSDYVSAEAFSILNSNDFELLGNWLADVDWVDQLKQRGVDYVVVPFDSQGEIFQSDRKYSAALRQSFVTRLQNLEGLTQIFPEAVKETVIFKIL